MDFFKPILFLALSATILLSGNIPTSTADDPSSSPADAPLTFHIVSHDNPNPSAPPAAAAEDKKKPSKKGVLGTTINPALRDICQATKTPNKCMDYLAPIATRAGGTYQDPVAILNLEVELLYKKVEKAKDDADEIMMKKDGSVPSEVAKGLSACVEQYNKATDDLAKALVGCSQKNGATVEQMLTSALQSIRSCDAAFGGKSGKDAPMVEINEKMIDMASLGIEISSKWLTKVNA